MKRFFLSLFVFVVGLSAFAQDDYLKDIPETEAMSKQVAELFRQNKINQAFDALSPYWPLPDNEIESMEEKTIKYVNMLADRIGSPIGILKVKTETIGDVAIRETYLVRYEVSAIRLKFIYYKNKDGWIVNGFLWDDTFSEEFH